MKSEEREREPAASSRPPVLSSRAYPVASRLSSCFVRASLFAVILFFLLPLLPLASLYSRFYLAALYPPTLHGHTTRAFFFSGFHLPASHFLAPRYKRPTNDRAVPPSRATENISLAGPIFNYYPPRRRTPASERGSGGNLGRVLTYTSSHVCVCVCLSQMNVAVYSCVSYGPTCARQDFTHKFQNNHVSVSLRQT